MSKIISISDIINHPAFTGMCDDGREWLEQYDSLEEAWKRCPDGTYLLYFIDTILERLDLDLQYDKIFSDPDAAVRIVIRILEETPHTRKGVLMDYLKTSKKSLPRYDNTVNALKQWCDGDRSIDFATLVDGFIRMPIVGWLAPELSGFLMNLATDDEREMDGSLQHVALVTLDEVEGIDSLVVRHFFADLVREYITWDEVEKKLKKVMKGKKNNGN